MANSDNKCSVLDVELKESNDFDLLFKIQNDLQRRLGCKFEEMSTQEVVDFNFKNKHAFDDEFCEFMDAIGGIDDGIGNAGWKWWKRANADVWRTKISQLSDNDTKELKFEVVDMFHFAINMALSVGMTGSELFSMYLSKNEENFNRQEKGY